MGSTAELRLRWSSYEKTLLMSVCDMWDTEAMTDVSVSAEGKIIRAHKVVLSSCSGYFREVLQNVTPAQHPVIVLPFSSYQDLLAVIQFMYKGEINITQVELPGLLACAESLQVKGLAKINPLKASGLLQEAYQQTSKGNCGSSRAQQMKTEPYTWNHQSSVPCSHDERKNVESSDVSDDKDMNLIVDEDSPENMLEEVEEGSDCNESPEDIACGNDSNLSGSEQSEGKLYFLTSLGQHEELQEPEAEGSDKSSKKVKTRRRKRGEIMRALSAAWNCGRNSMKERPINSQRSGTSIRKTLLPVSCPVCFKVLSNAYNLKVHMSIHDGLSHQCSICGHTSKSRDALRKHLAYRHLIGMSGPVRPRMPNNKRKKGGGDANEESYVVPHQPNEREDLAQVSSAPNYSDPDNDLLSHSGGEDAELNDRPPPRTEAW